MNTINWSWRQPYVVSIMKATLLIAIFIAYININITTECITLLVAILKGQFLFKVVSDYILNLKKGMNLCKYKAKPIELKSLKCTVIFITKTKKLLMEIYQSQP